MKEKMFLTLISMYLLSLIFAVSVSADPSNHLGTIMDKPASVTFIAFFTDDDDILTYGAQGTYYIPGDGKWVFDEGSFDVEPAFGETGYIWLYGSNNKCYKSNYTLVQDDPTPYDWGEGQLSESNIEPPSLSATPGPPGTITLNWTAVDGATTYTIYRSVTSNGAYETRVVEDITDTTYVDIGLEHQTYYYIVVGKDDNDNFGGHSNEASSDVLLYGDVSADGNITAYDASLVLQYVIGLIGLSPEAQDAADVTGNDTVTALDAALILQYCVGLITEFPRE